MAKLFSSKEAKKLVERHQKLLDRLEAGGRITENYVMLQIVLLQMRPSEY